ncbi:deoxyguanosinetriphosphate triphosphohydrolase [Asticcacaulis sp. YBE204]|uniref:deoxyguanosinetriphosphate triphosphohydrolase n=1 Tax=Asticcacaulis sp. YBE204 TaxID=1282363 RepID=UPI0003C3D481|nr:deoxyguanosinetriphosphate triphosphohydrolase [Asticcacaulis sp. YBE204]ESQ80586.1 deoxyguanosinetriphosphate triphosphohydrolase [Asticcacaulis sp. YBE204]
MTLTLAPFAENAATSKGRLYQEAESSTRTPFARDRDRVIHCTAFRRLKGKTQVFVADEGDYFRTRLTHSLEVSQVARSLAHTLGADQDLAETIALSHDLGHSPFGHAGEDELHAMMEPWGGFDHNVQTFRIVTRLEHRYPAFEGLNLTWETLEGIIKHNGPVAHKLGKPSWKSVGDFSDVWDLRLETYASLEAQIAAISDDIAYNNHDVDDGLRAGLFTLDELRDIPLIGPAIAEVEKDWPLIDTRLLRLEAIRRVIGFMIRDVCQETETRLRADGIETAEDVRRAKRQMVQFSHAVNEDLSRLRAFLYAKMYKHFMVNRTRSQAKRVLGQMFTLFMEEPEVLPPGWFGRVCTKDTEAQRARVVCDYIAGMTDSFAISQHKSLFSL